MNNIRKRILSGFIATAGFILPITTSVSASAATKSNSSINVSEQDKEKVNVYIGNYKLREDIQVEGYGACVTGHIDGSIMCYDMNELYEAYNLTDDDDYNKLFKKIKSDSDRTVIKNVLENAQKQNLEYNLNFVLQGDDFTETVDITEKSAIVIYKGKEFRFISNRPQDSGAIDEFGEKYNGYRPI